MTLTLIDSLDGTFSTEGHTPLALVWSCKPCLALPLILIEIFLSFVVLSYRLCSVQKRLTSRFLPRTRTSSRLPLEQIHLNLLVRPPLITWLFCSHSSESLTHTHVHLPNLISERNRRLGQNTRHIQATSSLALPHSSGHLDLFQASQSIPAKRTTDRTGPPPRNNRAQPPFV